MNTLNALTIPVPQSFTDELTQSLRQLYTEAMEQARLDALQMKEYLTPQEAMQFITVTSPTLQRWEKEGLPFYKVEGKKFYSKKELYEFIQAHKHTN